MAALAIAAITFPIRSFALFGVGDLDYDAANTAVGVHNGVEAALQTVDQYFGYLKTFGLDGLAYSLAQKASQKLVSATLNAVNGGASQNKPPTFITNYAQYFQGITGKTTTNYYSQLSSSNNPFASAIAVDLANSTSGYATSGLNSFNLDKVLTNGASWQSASTNLATAGGQGFDYYSRLSYPQNTPMGSTLIAQQQLNQNITTAFNIAKVQLTSTGFKPQTAKNTGEGIFAAVGSQYGVNTNALINASTNAANTQHNINNVNNAQANGGLQDTGAAVNSQLDAGMNSGTAGNSSAGATDANGAPTNLNDIPQDNPDDPSHPYTNTTPGTYYGPGGDPSGSGAGEENYSGSNDVGAKITNPSATNASTVNNSTQETQKRLGNADEFFKLIFSTLTQMVTGLINVGISKLTSDAGSSSPYQYGSPASVATSGKSWLAGPQTIIDFRSDLDIANQKTALDVKYNQQLLDLLKAPVTGQVLNSAQAAANAPITQGMTDTLQKLEQCIPGPDTGWDTRLQQYTDAQLKSTQNRGSQDNEKGAYNSRAYKLVQQTVQTAIQEEQERIGNPFLNIPSAVELRTIASSYYATAKKFQGIFSTLLIKRQVSTQLMTLVAQTKAFMPTLVLFDDQWSKLSAAQQTTLYNSVKTGIVADFPEDYTQIDANGDTVIKDLPADDATTTDVDERTAEMERRVLDEEWHIWETDTVHITEAQRQKLYQQFASIKNNITDSVSLHNTENLVDSVKQQNMGLADALHDCLAIRDAVRNYTQYPNQAAWDTFKGTLYSTTVKLGFIPSTSIIAVANGTAGIDFSKEGDITLPLSLNDIPGSSDDLAAYVVPTGPSVPLPPGMGSLPNAHTIADEMALAAQALLGNLSADNNPRHTLYLHWVDHTNPNALQVQPAIPITRDTNLNTEIGTTDPIGALYQEDIDGALFCRLPAYTLNYWIPDKLTGVPIGCYDATVGGYSSSHGFSTAVAQTTSHWYSTNRAEIYYTFTDGE
ncbi:MAG: hypothetical protein JWM20_294 [Patescibacteria group bacterium]|nr:hypothetical protein [Patescibacteria group bacterium]